MRIKTNFSKLFTILGSAMLILAAFTAQSQQETQQASAPEMLTEEDVILQVELPEASGDLLDAIRQRGELQVGVSTFIPWAMRNKDSELIGFEVDIAKQLAEDLGVELKLVPTSWSNIISDLLDGHYDVIISGLSITPERALQVEFSQPYHYSDILLLANKAKAGKLTSPVDFNKAEITIGVRSGTTAAKVAARAFSNAKIEPFEVESTLYEAVRNGNLHALVGSSPRPAMEPLRFPEDVYLPMENNEEKPEYLARTAEGFAVRKGNQSLLNYLNAWIQYHSYDDFLKEKDRIWFRTLDWTEQL